MAPEKPQRFQGYREIQETKKEIPVDGKKFQEQLSKVQESDSSQQQGKRNLKKSEEETEDTEGKNEKAIPASGDLFSLFMSTEDSTTIMSPQTPQNIRATQAPSSSSSFNIEETSEKAPFASPSLGQPLTPQTAAAVGALPSAGDLLSSSENSLAQGALPPSTEEAVSEEGYTQFPAGMETLPSSSSLASPSSQPIETAGASETTSPTRVKKKKTEDTSLLAHKKPSSAQLLKKKKDKQTPEIKLTKAPQKTSGEKKTEPSLSSKKPSEKQPPTIKANKPGIATPAKPTIQEEKKPVSEKARETFLQKEAIPEKVVTSRTSTPLEKNKPIEKGKETSPGAISSLTQGAETSHDRKDKRDDKDKKDHEASAPISQAVPMTPFVPSTEIPAPVYASLHPQVYELFERMVGLMTVELHKGVTTTTVTINMKGSIFDGAQIVLDHYSTAPNAFNLTIAASPQGQELLNAHIGNLAAAFQASKLSFDVNVRKPILLEEHQAFQRKEKVGEEKDQNKREQGG